jgi:hypothetical protein
MGASEQAAKSSGKRRSFVVGNVDFEHGGTTRRWERLRFAVIERTADDRRRDLSDLISVYEAQPASRLHGDAVEEVQLGNLKNVMNGAELRPTGANHGCVNGQGLIGNRASLVHRYPSPSFDGIFTDTLTGPN